MHLKRLLSILQLSEKQIEIYIFLFINGAQAGSVIAKHIRIGRTTIYHTLSKLQKNGFIVSYKRSGVSFFTVSNLDRVMYVINTQRSLINIQSDAIHKILEIEAEIIASE